MPIDAVAEQLLRHARADHLDAAIVDAVAERVAHLDDDGLLGRFAAGLLRDTDQHVAAAAELLQLHLAETESSRVLRICEMSTVPLLACTSMSVPPLKSMPRLRP